MIAARTRMGFDFEDLNGSATWSTPIQNTTILCTKKLEFVHLSLAQLLLESVVSC
jgi:hypothetical protein